MKLWMLHFLALCLLFQSGLSQTVVKSLPGLPGDLPFYLETGYIGVGELEDVQLFYYFVKSERSPKDDPLVLWLTGGPGCSALSAIVYEIGPFTFNYENSTRDRPTLKLHEYSWTKVASVIFLDQPVGTGFSYANSWESYNMNDNISAAETYEFLRKWLKLHPEFLSNPLYIAGDSYSGITVPMVTLQVAKGNDVGLKPKMNLEGYLLGNPATNISSDMNSIVPFAHLKALISDELYENYNYMYSYIWASDRAVQDALHVREGTIEKWVRCNETLSYIYTVSDVIGIHKELIKMGFRVLIYR
ncbi:hypothetical protein NL676_038988 [Syzygium grande]|nr:hypothetical protein NL676_038988 [Syzygium grande]